MIKMESKDELKEVDIKNRTRYYFNDTMRVSDIYFNNISLDEISFENIFIYEVSCKKKQMGLSKFAMKLDIYKHLVTACITKSIIEFDVLYVKKS